MSPQKHEKTLIASTSTSPPPSPSPFPSQQQSQPQPQLKSLPRTIHLVKSHPTLSPFRRRIYLVLLSIPPGRWTTYAALARYMSSTTSSTTSNTTPSKSKLGTKPGPKTRPREAGPGKGNGSPRAIGTAMRTNPFAPDVPCHRVLAADGTLGGYMGDGPGSGGKNLRRKREMLEGEGVRFSMTGTGDGGGDGMGTGRKGRQGKGPRAEGECFVEFVG